MPKYDHRNEKQNSRCDRRDSPTSNISTMDRQRNDVRRLWGHGLLAKSNKERSLNMWWSLGLTHLREDSTHASKQSSLFFQTFCTQNTILGMTQAACAQSTIDQLAAC